MKQLLLCLAVSLLYTNATAQKFKQLQDQATLECEKGNFGKAIEISGQAIVLAAKDKKADQQDLLSLRSENAAYYLLDEQVDQGLGLFAELLTLVENKPGFEKAEMNVRQNYGIALVYLGEYAAALPHLERAAELGKSQGMKPKDRIAVIGSLAVCHQSLYRFTRAEELFLEATRIAKSEGLSNTVDNAGLQSSFALLYRDLQQPHKAKACYDLAEKIFVGTGDTMNPQFPVFLVEYGTMLAESFLFEKALSVTYRACALDLGLYGENSTAYSADLNNLGYIYNRMNRTVEAEQFYTKALAIKKNLPYQRLTAYYTAVSNLIVFYSGVGRTEDAKELAPLMEEALANAQFTDTLKRAVFANNLGVHFNEWSDYGKSERYFREAIRYYDAIYGPSNKASADQYMDMTTLYLAQSNWTELKKCLEKAGQIYSGLRFEEDASTAIIYSNLVQIFRELNKPAEAMAYADKALALAGRLSIAQPDILEPLYLAKAQVCGDVGRVKESTDYFHKYIELKYSQLDRNFSYMTEHEKLFFLEKFERNITNYYTVILSNIEKYPELVETLLDFRLRTKSLLLNNLTQIKRRISSLNDPALDRAFEEMKLKREAVAKLMNFNTDEYPDALAEAEKLKKEADQAEKEISLKVSGLIAGNTGAVTWRDVQKQLGPGEAAIEVFQSYLIYDNNQGKGVNYTFIILKSTGTPIAVSIDRPFSWETQLMQHYRNAIDHRKDDPSLYGRTWAFMSPKLADCNTIYFSPDGIYNQINPNTLFNGQSGAYLLEEKSIHVVTSLRDINAVKKREPLPATIALAGNPMFDMDLSKARPGTSAALATRGAYGFVLSELPGTKTEIESIGSILKPAGLKTTVLTEADATEGNIKKVKSPGVLHIATHGFFLEDVPEEQLAGYARLEKDYYRNPMLRSGIFFTGSNLTYSINTGNAANLKDFEDGMLTAYEAMNLDLEGTKLVVLSACQTGLGKVKNGEGVYGLQRAFTLAGAEALIMSLWPVSDEATKDLMISFYRNWSGGKDIYGAFRDAQVELKKTYPEPYYWGAFVLIGK